LLELRYEGEIVLFRLSLITWFIMLSETCSKALLSVLIIDLETRWVVDWIPKVGWDGPAFCKKSLSCCSFVSLSIPVAVAIPCGYPCVPSSNSEGADFIFLISGAGNLIAYGIRACKF